MQHATIQTALISTTRQKSRVARINDRQKQLLVGLLLWLLLCLLASAANYSDISLSETDVSFFGQFRLFILLLSPLCLLSLCLTLVFDYAAATLLRPKNICLLYFFLLLTFFPSFVYFELFIQHIFYSEKFLHLAKFLRSPTGPNTWIDGMVFTSVFAVHVFYALWCQAQRRMGQLQAAKYDNLALRLSLLQGQLEPQFLLSSLDGIGVMVRDAERPQAIRALARLSDLLRYALRSGQQEWLSVADEIGFIRDYLDLQRLRFGARLDVQVVVDEHNWAMYACPALLLHQLVEQTIGAGLQGEADHLTLRLAFSLRNDRICIVLTHSQRVAATAGASAPPSRAPNAPNALNVLNERLQLIYGNTASIESEVVDAARCVTLCFSAQGRPND